MTHRERALALTNKVMTALLQRAGVTDAIERTLVEVERETWEAAAKAAAGPDEGYLHGCDCRLRIRAHSGGEGVQK